ncbi:MAG TPA: transcription elongation factor GreA [Clostridiales bacterium]|nr:transcription elongation factor GreA [Clostridiales bacterium]
MFDELTQKDIDDMNAEIEERIKLREGYHEDIVMAKSYGDLSENAEYHEAKRSKNKNEARIRYLRNMIKTATIINANFEDDGKVNYLDKVTIFFEDDGEEEDVVISTKMRVDATKGVISKESPLGSAIFGKKVGDRVFVNVSDDVKYYVIIKSISKGTSGADVPINKY